MPVAALWKEISTNPIGQNSGQMKKSVLDRKQFGSSARTNSTCSISYIAVGRRRCPVQPTNYMGEAESDIIVNIKGRANNMNDLIVPNMCLS